MFKIRLLRGFTSTDAQEWSLGRGKYRAVVKLNYDGKLRCDKIQGCFTGVKLATEDDDDDENNNNVETIDVQLKRHLEIVTNLRIRQREIQLKQINQIETLYKEKKTLKEELEEVLAIWEEDEEVETVEFVIDEEVCNLLGLN